MASEEITSKRHADFRNWYDMPDGTTLGILDLKVGGRALHRLGEMLTEQKATTGLAKGGAEKGVGRRGSKNAIPE
jgi:hypothetical protein